MQWLERREAVETGEMALRRGRTGVLHQIEVSEHGATRLFDLGGFERCMDDPDAALLNACDHVVEGKRFSAHTVQSSLSTQHDLVTAYAAEVAVVDGGV